MKQDTTIDTDAAMDFLQKVRPGGPWVLSVDDRKMLTRTFTAADEAKQFIADYNGDGFNIYYSINPTRGVLNKKAEKEDIVAVEYHQVDADPRPDESPEEYKARMLPVIKKFRPRPTFIVHTGNGFQLLWERQKPVKLDLDETIAKMEAISRALASNFEGDAAHNVDRIFRVAGTINYPTATKLKIGRVECQATLIEYDDAVYRDEDFPRLADAPHKGERKDNTSARAKGPLPPQCETILHLPNPDAGPYNTRSGALWAFLLTALRAGTSESVILGACLDRSYIGKSIYEHVREKGGEKYLLRQIQRAAEQVPQSSTPAHSWEEPDVSLLDDRRSELPDFPLERLPEVLQPIVKRLARGAGVLPDHVVTLLLGIASALIGSARRVQASKSWTQPLTSWCVLVGDSGDGKTPAIEAIKRPLDELQEELQDYNDTARREHQERSETAAAVKSAWIAAVKVAAKDGKKPPPKPEAAEEPDAFVAPRLYVIDVTIERLAQLLQVRPRGMLLLEDELAGLFANLSRYSRGDDKSFWLKAWNGGAHSVERKSAPKPIEVPNLLVGIVGGMQPDKLADCFKGAADGMYARFVYAWPKPAPYRPMSENAREIDDDLIDALEVLVKLKDRKPPTNRVPLSKEGRAVFEELRKIVHNDRELFEGRARDWWAKVPAHVLRLAGTLTYLDWALTGSREPDYISADFIEDAAFLVVDYFWPHAQECLRQIGVTQSHTDARRVLRWLRAKGDLQQVSREDIRRYALGKQRDADETQAIIEFLVRAGWLQPLPVNTGAKGGRPAYRWAVNPRL